MLARWGGVKKVGFWDYRYFIYCDDADWCLRFAQAGYRVVLSLDAVVYHTPWHHKLTPARAYYAMRNIMWVLRKVLPLETQKREVQEVVLPAAPFLSDMPKAALAGLIIASVVPLLNPDPVWRTRGFSPPQFVVAAVTFAVSVAAAPRVQWGVIAGVVCALAVHLWRELGLDIETWRTGDVLNVRPQGVLYFGSAPLLETRILAELADHPSLDRVKLHLQRLGRIDLTGALVLRAITRDLARADVPVEIQGVQPHCQRLVESVFSRDEVGYTRRPENDLAQDHHVEDTDDSSPRPADA